mmetsp:Transcript_1467/g.1939  ORF Transcript_1467/g.1939 Transcript_1467/m.1939 type:complete len:148 (-) Transcript_1467:31-474(-)
MQSMPQTELQNPESLTTPAPKFSSLDLEHLRAKQEQWVNERDWNRFHTPRNLLLALVGEVGELSECFQWKGEVQDGLPDWTEHEKTHLGEEMSDVLIYLTRLADKCGIDLSAAVLRKIELNSRKYPAKENRESAVFVKRPLDSLQEQ